MTSNHTFGTLSSTQVLPGARPLPRAVSWAWCYRLATGRQAAFFRPPVLPFGQLVCEGGFRPRLSHPRLVSSQPNLKTAMAVQSSLVDFLEATLPSNPEPPACRAIKGSDHVSLAPPPAATSEPARSCAPAGGRPHSYHLAGAGMAPRLRLIARHIGGFLNALGVQLSVVALFCRSRAAACTMAQRWLSLPCRRGLARTHPPCMRCSASLASLASHRVHALLRTCRASPAPRRSRSPSHGVCTLVTASEQWPCWSRRYPRASIGLSRGQTLSRLCRQRLRGCVAGRGRAAKAPRTRCWPCWRR